MRDFTHVKDKLLNAHLLPVVLALIVVSLALAGNSATELFRYHTTEIKSGEIWRLITGNLVHLSWSHTLMNLLGLGLIWGLFWDCFSPKQWLLVSISSGLSVCLGLLILNPELVWYVGLSGILHGLFLAGAVGGIRRGDRREIILLVAIVGKLIWEQVYGALPGSADMAGGPVVVDSHLYGAIGGAMVGLLLKPRMWRASN